MESVFKFTFKYRSVTSKIIHIKNFYNFLESVPRCGKVVNIPASVTFTFTPSKICIAQFRRCRACWHEQMLVTK